MFRKVSGLESIGPRVKGSGFIGLRPVKGQGYRVSGLGLSVFCSSHMKLLSYERTLTRSKAWVLVWQARTEIHRLFLSTHDSSSERCAAKVGASGSTSKPSA